MPMAGKFLLIYLCNFHVSSHLLLIYICKLHWNLRPVIEYVRDVYSELMSIGEGLKKPGDRDDVSSDEGGDELEDARRNWSRQPLKVNYF